ncbi:protein MALE DISCOVERER 2-like [Andrographis paniculata]|uniref:protein MALE DISCOVERER 2-like n=1 Tax=Andrographis paniculata TaxID=175694 RepID=UPI0021E6FE85|nr:protein MALE DISCOVERER 2-like [Andrographis paniculata]XP_051125217.1 protein MALE DISCOVERER 2-like [Andrographis paniculata]XP_051125218.1 protein MALE DISCOVERER 2-like [Andrographis paniculata]
MGEKWTAYGLQLFCLMFSILVFKVHGCCTLNSEGLALFQFRSKVEADPFGAFANWNPNDCDPCMWSGIECLDGQVVTLNQSGLDLEGVLAPELGNLMHLRILDLSKNHLSGTIPPEFGRLLTLEVLDLRDNYLSGTVPTEIGRLHSLKRLLLCNNQFEGSIPVEVGKLSLLSDFQFDGILSTASAVRLRFFNRKFGHFIWPSFVKPSKKTDSFKSLLTWRFTDYLDLLPKFMLRNDSSQECAGNCCINEAGANTCKEQANNVRRVLVEQPANLAALPANLKGAPIPNETAPPLPSRSSGSFPAIPNKKLAPAPAPSSTSGHESSLHEPPSPAVASQSNNEASRGSSGSSLTLIILISIAVLLLIVAAVVLFVCRRKAKTIRPWKTGLSGQLQKAFVTGVPKLNRSELETACEDFSNIVYTKEGVATLFKGTLSSGVEIAVGTTAIASKNTWSKRAEIAFRKEIDSLSRVNHKNFSNLIGYCCEDEPFTRMMVFEYAPNGSLFERLHVVDIEHLDWNARMRVIMGVAYCLQHLHGLNPPLAHLNLNSNEVFLTDDHAAKIADVSFWEKLVSTSKSHTENDTGHSGLPPHSDVETNIHSFGILMLEVISGRLPYSEEQGNILDWANSYIHDKKIINQLIDPTLESFNDDQLDAVCEAIRECTKKDLRERPCMSEVILKLKQGLDISPEVACPRLSPLWWAELEILSSEAT